MNYKSELNQNQYEAVTSNAKYLRIIAGAGSGKTRVLTYRIAYLIEAFQIDPYQILAITFTNKVAKEMKERTIKLLPDYNLDGLMISTFHSFCARFLRREIEVLGITNRFLILDDEDQTRLIKNIAADFGFRKSDDIVDEARKFISKNKTEGKLPSDIVVDKLKTNEKKFYNFFVEYEKRKNEMKSLDFDDLLIYTIIILENYPLVKARYNNRYTHILVDEFQDTNNTQYRLLKLLMGDNTSLYVVGDPDQTIYTWRGANQSIIMQGLKDDFYPLKTIVLNENYRSTSEILNAANKLIAYNKEREPKDLFTNNGNGKRISINSFDNSLLEGKFVANKILELKREHQNFTFNQVAILYRSSYLSLKIENALIANQIPYKVYGGTKFYARKEIKDCLAYFRLLINEDDDISFERIINVPRRGIGDTSVLNLKEEARNGHLSMIKYIKDIIHFDTSLKAKVINEITSLIHKLDDTRNKLTNNLESYSEVLNEFIVDIGYHDYLEEKDETKDKVENVKALIDDIRSYLKEHPESSFDEYLQNITLITSQDEIENQDNVSLMTVHTAKGLEFDYVFIIGLNQGVFPNRRASEESSRGLEEERRLAYVAFTRAKKELYLTLNREYSYSLGMNNIPSMFIKEAGIKFDNFRFIPPTSSNGPSIYQFNMNNPYEKVDKPKYNNSNIISVTKSNGIKWEVGDTCFHKVFKEGKVLKVEGDIIEVDFKDFGKKTLLGNHPMLSKKEN
ncbi:MAG TPA: ATP-dependent DNA helicase PcrA [Clostridiales bacterium]|nr:ATP-dependent DNA helicase PcrA [Clostridiales bacterium]